MKIRDKIQIFIKKDKKKNHTKRYVYLCVNLFLLSLLYAVFPHAAPEAAAQGLTQHKTTDNDLSVTLVGNIDYSGYPNWAGKYDLLEGISAIWQDSDIVVGSLNTALVNEDQTYTPTDQGCLQYVNETAAVSLKSAGITTLAASNAGTSCCGIEGLINTKSAIESNSMKCVGIGRGKTSAMDSCRYEAAGKSISIFSVADETGAGIITAEDGSNWYSASSLNGTEFYKKVAAASAESDLVVVYLYAGDNKNIYKTDKQTDISRALIDAGADIVVNTCQDAVQPIELYKKGIILYGLGDLVSDSGFSYQKNSLAANYCITEDGTATLTLIPIRRAELMPGIAVNSIYLKSIQNKVTKNLNQESYSIDKNGCVIVNVP